MTDAQASYFFALRMCRLRGLLLGEFWPHEEDEFDLYMAAVLMRELDRGHEWVSSWRRSSNAWCSPALGFTPSPGASQAASSDRDG